MLQSTNDQAITLTFDSLDIDFGIGPCSDWVEVNDGSSTLRFCGPYYGDYYNVAYDNLGSSIPGPFTSTATITVKFSSNSQYTKSGFLAVVCCSPHVTTTDLTSGKQGKPSKEIVQVRKSEQPA